MCGEIDAHITRLEEQVRKLKEFCEWQRIMLESIFAAFDAYNDAITAARSASTMTGTSEE